MSALSYPLSIVVMTYNEEANIERCLRSVEGIGDEILVLDSYSTDQTVELSRKMGARVEQFPFNSYADQRRRMVQLAKNDWIFTLDADEYVTPELKDSLLAALKENKFDAFTSHRRSSIGGTWLNHGSWYPDKKIRMFDRRKVSVIGNDVHESIQPITDVSIGHLKGDLMHLADINIGTRYQKINSYSTRAAQDLFASGKKGNLLRILIKPFIRFLITYVIKAGYLDGYYGWIVAKSEGHYVWLREVKLWEISRRASAQDRENVRT